MFNAMPPRDHQFSVASRCELLPYLMTLPLGLSRKQAKDLLRFRAVTVKRMATVRHDTPLEPGDVVTIAAGKQLPAESIEHQGLKIVYLDDAVAVVEKRAGLLSMGSEGEKERTAHRILNDHLKALTKSAAQQAFIVHRLDRGTSGLMLFARSRAIQAALQQNWKTVTKKYLAVVEGVPAKAEGTLRDHLVESKSFRMHRVERGGELAITHYRVLRTGRGTRWSSSRSRPAARIRFACKLPAWVIRSSAIANTAQPPIRAPPRAPFERAEVSPSRDGRLDGIPQRNANPPDGLARGARRQTNDTAIDSDGWRAWVRSRIDAKNPVGKSGRQPARRSQSRAAPRPPRHATSMGLSR